MRRGRASPVLRYPRGCVSAPLGRLDARDPLAATHAVVRVDLHAVAAGAAVDGVPLAVGYVDHVVARSGRNDITAHSPVDAVVTVTTVEAIVPVAARETIVAGAAEDAIGSAQAIDHVVAVEAVELVAGRSAAGHVVLRGAGENVRARAGAPGHTRRRAGAV